MRSSPKSDWISSKNTMTLVIGGMQRQGLLMLEAASVSPLVPSLNETTRIILGSKLHPTPTLASRTIKRKEQMCVLDYTFKRARREIPSISPFSSSSSAAASSLGE